MAAETGTATDYRDLLQKLKLFLTGESVSPVGSNGLNWTVEEERSKFTSPQTDIAINDSANGALEQFTAQHDQTHDQMIFRSTGGSSPENPCFFAIQTYGYSVTGYYNWQIRGLTGFTTKSPEYQNLNNQPGISPPCYLLLQNTTMTYWFIATNRHVKGCIKTGSSYQPFYIGLLNTFATTSEYPYPMSVCGTSYTEATLFSTNGVSLGATPLLNGGGNNDQDLPATDQGFPGDAQCSGWIRYLDGRWYGLKNFYGTTNENYLQGTGNGLVHSWPLANMTNTVVAANMDYDDDNEFNQDYKSSAPGGNPISQVVQAFASPPLTTLWPLTAYIPHSKQILGEFDGCYWAPAAGGLTSEDEIIDAGESPEVTNIVFQNVWRTDAWQFIAMRYE